MDSERWHRSLTLVFLLGAAGTSAELVLLGHYEEWQQWLPLVLLACGVAAGVAQLGASRHRAARGLRLVAVAMVMSGLLGMYFHLESNVGFELERDAAVGGFALARESLTGAIPALAPGAMILLGLIGLLIAAGHPALAHRSRTRTNESHTQRKSHEHE